MFEKSDGTELCIREMNNIRMIHIYELTGVGTSTGGCMAVSVFYGDRQTINLCELDPCFDLLVDRVYELYDDLKDDEAVIIDDATRAVLELGMRHTESTVPDYYYGLESLDIPKVPLESLWSARFLPVTEYIIVNLYKLAGSELVITGRKAGWRGASMLFGQVNSERRTFGIKITRKNDELFAVKVVNFLTENGELLINIALGAEKMNISFAASARELTGNSSYIFTERGCNVTHTVFSGKDRLYYENIPAGTDSEDITTVFEISADEAVKRFGLEKQRGLIPQTGNVEIIRLPQNMFYIRECKTTENEGRVREQLCCTYLYGEASFSDTRYDTHISNPESGNTLNTMSAVMHRTLLRGGEMQTYFVPHSGNAEGRYRKYLEGYFFLEPGAEIAGD